MSTIFIFKKENKRFLLITHKQVPPQKAIRTIWECLETKTVGPIHEKMEVNNFDDLWERVRRYSHFGRWATDYQMLMEAEWDKEKKEFEEVHSFYKENLYRGIEDQIGKTKPSEVLLNVYFYQFCYVVDMSYKKISFYGDGTAKKVNEMIEMCESSIIKNEYWRADYWEITSSELEDSLKYLELFCANYYYTPSPGIKAMFKSESERMREEEKSKNTSTKKVKKKTQEV